MSFITDIFSSGASKVVDSVSNGLDSLFTSDEERLLLKNELQKSMNSFEIEMEKGLGKYEKEITERWKSDNEHTITRLVRPASYIFVLLLFACMVMFDGNFGDITINSAYIPVVETLLATMTIAYFGSRGVEKTVKHFKGNQ